MSRINVATLTALLALQQREPAETLPGCDGEGVFAQALKQAEAERREEATKALVGIAKEIQDSLAQLKQEMRGVIRYHNQQIDLAKSRLNKLDAAASALGGNSPNPFPLLAELGMISRHSLSISQSEYDQLVTVPIPR